MDLYCWRSHCHGNAVAVHVLDREERDGKEWMTIGAAYCIEHVLPDILGFPKWPDNLVWIDERPRRHVENTWICEHTLEALVNV